MAANLTVSLLSGVATVALQAFPAVPPSAPPASAAQYAALERRALQTTDPADHAQWLQADMDRHFKPLVGKGNRPFAALPLEQATLPTLLDDMAAYETRKSIPPDQRDSLKGRATYAFNRLKSLPRAAAKYNGIHEAFAQGTVGALTVREAAEPGEKVFTHIILGDHSASDDGPDQTRNCSIKTPFLVRMQQLKDTSAALHEEMHLRRLLKGDLASDTPYNVYKEEVLSDTYTALRMSALLGKEGGLYVHHESLQQTQAVALSPVEGRPFQLEHMSQRQVQEALTYASRHDISKKTPEQLVQLAEKIAKLMPPADFAVLMDHVSGTTDLPLDEASARTQAQQGGWPAPVRQFYADLANAYRDVPTLKEELNALNPLHLKGTKPQYLTFAPDLPEEYAATKTFNEKRRPATCRPFDEEVHSQLLAKSPKPSGL